MVFVLAFCGCTVMLLLLFKAAAALCFSAPCCLRMCDCSLSSYLLCCVTSIFLFAPLQYSHVHTQTFLFPFIALHRYSSSLPLQPLPPPSPPPPPPPPPPPLPSFLHAQRNLPKHLPPRKQLITRLRLPKSLHHQRLLLHRPRPELLRFLLGDDVLIFQLI